MQVTHMSVNKQPSARVEKRGKPHYSLADLEKFAFDD
jgi:hypothetical protein